MFWLNSFPTKSGILDTYSLQNILTGTGIDFNNHRKLIFGAYVKDNEYQYKTNKMKERLR